MTTLENIVDILVLKKQGYSPAEIARRINCDPRTVRRYLDNPELLGKPITRKRRGSKLDAYRDILEVLLKEDPEYKSATIHRRLQQAGYTGGYTLVKDAVQSIKEERQRIAYIRFETEPGLQAQVDFGDFQAVSSDGTCKTYYLFSMILGHSRMLYADVIAIDKLSHLNSLTDLRIDVQILA